MADKLEVARIKELRGDIIESLYSYYGSEVSVGTLRSLLRYKSFNSPDVIAKAIEYLSGAKKEYITVRANEDSFDDTMLKLTPTGANLAEGDIEDLGVLLSE